MLDETFQNNSSHVTAMAFRVRYREIPSGRGGNA
jgi:hypothetical protein